MGRKTKTINLLAFARADKLASFMVADKGKTLISTDYVSGEPTVISHLTQDEKYKYATIDEPNKKVFYSGDFLYIDDVYLMVGSLTTYGQRIKEWYISNGGDDLFTFNWKANKEEILKSIKKERKVLKTTCLAILYGAMPKKIHETLSLAGESISLSECQDLYDTFWRTFSKITRFKEYITKLNKRQGHLVSLFGFRGTPHPKDSFNWTIQSSLNGVIINFLSILNKNFPEMNFHTLIHDEIILDIPEDSEDDFRLAHKQSQNDLNKLLEWSVESRFGLNFGKNYLTIK